MLASLTFWFLTISSYKEVFHTVLVLLDQKKPAYVAHLILNFHEVIADLLHIYTIEQTYSMNTRATLFLEIEVWIVM